MMVMVIKEAMFCASRLVSERSLGGGICAGGGIYPPRMDSRNVCVLLMISWNGIFVAAGFRRFVRGLYAVKSEELLREVVWAMRELGV